MPYTPVNLGGLPQAQTAIDNNITTNGAQENTGQLVGQLVSDLVATLTQAPVVSDGTGDPAAVFASAAQGLLADTAVQAVPAASVAAVSTTGNDATAVIGDLSKPFLTLLAAQTAATSGTTIMVWPGAYTSVSLGKNGVNWYFMPGANVAFTGNGFTAGTTMTYVVAGHGFFSGTGRLASITGGGCNIYVECQGADTANGFGITQINSKLIISVRDDWAIANGVTSDVTAAGALAQVKANSITVSAGGAVPFTITNGGMDIETNTFSYTGAATSMFLFNGGTLQLIRCRINAPSITGPVIDKTIAGGIARLVNTVIFGNPAQNTVDATVALSLFCEGSQVGTTIGASVTVRGSLYRAVVAVPAAGDVATISADGTWDWA